MRIIITGGGTGGHLFPGIALATALQEQGRECEIMFIGTSRQLDQDTLAGYDFATASISCMGLKGKGLFNRLKSISILPGAVMEAMRIIKNFQPDLVFGVGGYVTGPVLMAAKLLSVPTCIHEQNSVPGLANRMISRFVDRVFISIPGPSFPEKKTIITGNPVRQEILTAAENRKPENASPLTLLVLGGSLGAHRINLLMVEAMAAITSNEEIDVEILHQTGRADEETVRAGYEKNGVTADVAPFYTDMAGVYQKADLVVARAGATTLAELAVMGLPALLIPYPYAADDHQARNAQYYVAGGGAVMYREEELTGERLAEVLKEMLSGSGERQIMSANMKKMGRPEATRRIVDDCLQLIS
ncbi:MAG: undecaprenyldiphospho-muramoylpentapeptide beta-N-acetylglucosaminyltransferase [Desulfobulbus sp.]|nr:MAG: undecaprenyldiphospho-muramoylpentapeptide beta-N-acetylglucosaminyltransferase [Desulfobulbus sp.]